MTSASTLTASRPAPLWRPVIAAMGKSGAGSIGSGLLAALSTKIVAALLGPAYVALLQTLQQTRDAALAAATLNGQTALVQGASALVGRARREYLRTALGLVSAATLFVAAAMLLAPALIARLCGFPAGSETLVRWLSLPVALSSAFVFLNALLNILGNIGQMALLQVLATAALAAAAWPAALAVRTGDSIALVYLLTFSTAIGVLAAVAMLDPRRHTLFEWFRSSPARYTRWWSTRAAGHFVSISAAMLAGGLISSAVLLALRARISSTQGLASTGQFDAAWGISINHVTLVLASLQTYFLPALARARSAEERGRQTASVLAIATLAGAPIIVAIAVLKPLVLTIFYSRAFHPAASYLRWMLMGDYLKISSTVLSVPMLATGEMHMFLTADAISLAVFYVAARLISTMSTAAESASIAVLACYGVHLAVCYGYARRRHGFRLTWKFAAQWTTGLALVVGASASTWTEASISWPKAVAWIALAAAVSGTLGLRLLRSKS